jgi:hypothetical protein
MFVDTNTTTCTTNNNIIFAIIISTATIALFLFFANLWRDRKLCDKLNVMKTIVFPLYGTHEIHITINPMKSKNGFVGLENFASLNQKDKMKTYFSVSTGMNDQYMLSFYVCNMSDVAAVSRAIEVAQELRDKHWMDVVRVKVEYYTRQNFPISLEDYKKTQIYLAQVKDDFLLKTPALAKSFGSEWGVPYFEYHVKVKNFIGNVMNHKINDSVVIGSTYYDRLEFENVVREIDGGRLQMGVTYNIMSANKNSNLTIRLYDIGYRDAENYREAIVQKLKERGYVLDTKTEHEFCIYDSNTKLDTGLFATK